MRTLLVCVIGICAILPYALAEVQVEITAPTGTGKFVRGQDATFECEVLDEGDHEYWVLWLFFDQTEDAQFGEKLTRVTHTCGNAGEWHVQVIVWDGPPDKDQQLAEATADFWVLWVEIGVKADIGDEVLPDNEAAKNWWGLTRPYTTLLGPRNTVFGHRTGMEFYGVCTPAVWDEVVELRRRFGPEGGAFYGGAAGNTLVESRAAEADDTSDPMWYDWAPQSATTWADGPFAPHQYASHGVIYDIDWPGYARRETGSIYRIRANFWEYARYDGRFASADRTAHCAASVTWDGTDWQVDSTLAGSGDNSAGSGHLASTDWDLDG